MVSGGTKMWWVLLSPVWAVLCVDLAALQPLHIAHDGGLECGRLVPTGQGLARAKRQLNIRLTPFCSTSACLAQRAVGAGLLGAAGALA